MKIAAIEVRKNNFICGIITNNGIVVDKVIFPTTSPSQTLNKAIKYLKEQKFEAIGISCFGKLDLERKSSTYGRIIKTTKKEWEDFDLVGTFRQSFSCPIGFNNLHQALMLAEVKIGKIKKEKSYLYLNISDELCGVVVLNGKIINKITTKMNHMILKRHPQDNLESICPLHEECYVGLAGEEALRQRKIRNDITLTSYYIAQIILNYVLVYFPEKVILSGEIIKNKHMVGAIYHQFQNILNDYIELKKINYPNYIKESQLGVNAGLIGSGLLGEKEFKQVFGWS